MAASSQQTPEFVDKYFDKPELIRTIDNRDSVWGIALLDKQLFVVSIKSSALAVYDTNNFGLKRISIDLQRPRDLVAHAENKRLYIVEEGWKGLKPQVRCTDANGKLLLNWNVDTTFVYNVSIAKSGNLIVAVDGRIKEYSQGGRLVKSVSFMKLSNKTMTITNFTVDGQGYGLEIQQKENLDMTWHAMSLGVDGYLACQGWDYSAHHRVYILDSNWQISTSCEKYPEGCNTDLFSNPVYLVLDEYNNCVLVADSGNNRVVMLDRKKLTYIRVLLNSDNDICEPYRLLLDNETGRLYVGTNTNKLLIFQIREPDFKVGLRTVNRL